MRQLILFMSLCVLSISAQADDKVSTIPIDEFQLILDSYINTDAISVRDDAVTCSLYKNGANPQALNMLRVESGVVHPEEVMLSNMIIKRTTNLSTTYSNDDESFRLNIDEIGNINYVVVNDLECVGSDVRLQTQITEQTAGFNDPRYRIPDSYYTYNYTVNVNDNTPSWGGYDRARSWGNPCAHLSSRSKPDDYYVLVYLDGINGNKPYCVPYTYNRFTGRYTLDLKLKRKL